MLGSAISGLIRGERSERPTEREVARRIIEYLRRRGYVWYVQYPRPPIVERERLVDTGRYYSRQSRDLFIYVRERGTMIDPDVFPEELALFDSESAWRINSHMAIVNDAEEQSLNSAETVLSLHGFRQWDHPREVLEIYFALGDFSVFGEKYAN